MFLENKNGKTIYGFYYNGVCYDNATKVTFTDEYINNNLINGKKIFKYAIYYYSTVKNNGTIIHHFGPECTDWSKCINNGMTFETREEYAKEINIPAHMCNKIIKEVTDPHYVKVIYNEHKTDFDIPDVLFGWLIYIILMFASLIFKDFYYLWALISFYFFRWRKAMLNDDN